MNRLECPTTLKGLHIQKGNLGECLLEEDVCKMPFIRIPQRQRSENQPMIINMPRKSLVKERVSLRKIAELPQGRPPMRGSPINPYHLITRCKKKDNQKGGFAAPTCA